MAYSMAPQPTEWQNQTKARNILDGMSRYRIDPARIKTGDSAAGTRGGQGVVMVGTLVPPEGLKGLCPEAVEKFFRDGYSESLHDVLKESFRDELKEATPEQVKEAFFVAIKRLLFEQKVAVKRLEWPCNNSGESAKFFKSFVNELSLMASLSHPNIIKFLGFVEDMKEGDARIILPWEANGNVREFLQSGDWDIPERIQDTAKGLDYLHNRDPPICHGDLKSLNILVNTSYRAVITDFGSARIKRSIASEKKENRSNLPPQAFVNEDMAAELVSPEVKFDPLTLDLTLTGPSFSLRWTAPEVLDDTVQDLPSDMWAMGWICWEIVTDRIPFEELHRPAVIIKHTLDGKLPAIREDTGLSNVLALCNLMSACWISDPGKRLHHRF
ncbi:hypothetical protein FRC00_004343 [Tulasnella sp. 408]|nr:hypothetical protein FRC00_004343 [Tulasnella sp. 408]